MSWHAYKILAHRDKIEAIKRGEWIIPLYVCDCSYLLPVTRIARAVLSLNGINQISFPTE